jgi:threonine dehydratase
MHASLDEIHEARERIRHVIRRTPLVALHERFGADDLLLKLETQQPVGSFKLRGVFNAVSMLSDDERARGVSTVSAGNTAQALAWSARYFGTTSRSVMPDTAPQSKIDAVRAYGGEPVLLPVEEVFRFLKQQGWKEEPYAFIHPWTNPHVLTGHASLGLELLEDLDNIESVFIPVGGGGLMAGVGSAIKALRPEVRVVAVEPEGCPAFHESLKAGQPVEVPCETICDGVAVPYMTQEMFPLLRKLADATRLVSEQAVKGMVRRLALDQKIVVEASAALAAVAALQENPSERGCSVALVTGGSIDANKLAAILSDETLPDFV